MSMRRWPRLRASLLALLRALAVAMWTGSAAAQPQDEYSLKAAFLLKFPAFVEWSAGVLGPATRPIVICVIGGDPFGIALEEAAREQLVAGRPMTVEHLATAEPDRCHVAYFAGEASAVADGLRRLRGTPVLTVTDERRGGAEKGIVHFLVRDNRVRFEIDLAAARANQVVLGSRLVSLAHNLRQAN